MRRFGRERGGAGPSMPTPRNGSPSTQPYRRERPWCPPSRRVPHKCSGRRPNRYTGRVSGLPFRTRRTCLSSEGGHQGLPARRPSVESDGASRAAPRGQRRAMREARVRRTEKKPGRASGPGKLTYAIVRLPGISPAWPASKAGRAMRWPGRFRRARCRATGRT